jgi:tetratricopeptide (TPR) repeat protein
LRDPANAQAFENRGNASYAIKDYGRAIKEFSKAIKKGPKYVVAYRYRAQSYYLTREFRRAIASYDESTRRDLRNAADYMNTPALTPIRQKPSALATNQEGRCKK